MDPFTQRMLEKAQQRSRALGITNASKFPMSDCKTSGNMSASAATVASEPKFQTQKQMYSMQTEQQQSFGTPTTPTETFSNSNISGNNNTTKLQVLEKKAVESPNKVLRQFSAVNKENMDLGIEINIMTDKNVEVQVQVEEQDITDNETASNGEKINQPLAKIRDTSRNRLQRLGALYSNTDDLSSPIHRTEAQFYAGTPDAGDAVNKKPKQHYGKLVALANSISQWEDDISHHQITNAASVPPPKPDLPSRRLMQQQQQETETIVKTITATATAPSAAGKRLDETDRFSELSNNNKTKQLKWDPKVITSLEAQGFQRRDSSTVKYSYDYGKNDDLEIQQEQAENAPEKSIENEKNKKVNKLTTVIPEENSKPTIPARKPTNIKSNLVAGRAAVFEQKVTQSQTTQRTQKDPIELSLKERMQLFERNKGEAPMPKAAFGMAPSISQIRQEISAGRKEDTNENKTCSTSSSNSIGNVKTNIDGKVRDKVAALVATVTTISENKIKAEIHRQRQDDMQILANRFNKQKDLFTKEQQQQQQQEIKEIESKTTTTTTMKQTQLKTNIAAISRKNRPAPPPPPPPPPPMPTMSTTSSLTPIKKQSIVFSSKRRSSGNSINIDDNIDDDIKRAKKNSKTTTKATKTSKAKAQTQTATRLYPALSDLELNESFSDNENCCTTATVSAQNTGDELEMDHLHAANNLIEQQDDDNDSYMMMLEAADDNEINDDDSSVDICDGSLGREIMQVVQKKDKQQQQNQLSKQQQQHQLSKQQQQQQIKQIKEVRYADREREYRNAGGDSSLNSSEASMGIDDYLDEALDENDDDGDDDFTQESGEDDANSSHVSRESKGTTASNSFSFRKTSAKISHCRPIAEEDSGTTFQTPISDSGTTNNATATFVQPVTSELSINREDENVVTLVHTVSFYRKQQNANSASSTPVRKICREQQVLRSAADGGGAKLNLNFESTPRQHNNSVKNFNNNDNDDDNEDLDYKNSDTEGDSYKVQEKIQKLLDEVCKQQQVIAQTSQALNLCAATIEFSGSTESVEGERHLLVATHRRQACLDEVQRLRVEKSLRSVGAPYEKGRLTVKDIMIPLRQEYIRKLASDTISGHHLVCLLKYNEHVLATKTVPTMPGLLAVKFPDVLQLNNVYADFRITLEIYGMTAQRELLPHEVKYHINLNKKSGIKTPKKKGSDNLLVMPPVQSPAGPHVVRKPALVQYGFAIFSLREIQRTTWSLTQVLGITPLDGVVHMKVNCELSVSVEYKGFLTMFEDISGFGAWHRRWCHLNGTVLNYWKYPDDEKKKAPMGTIDLYTCSSQKVTTAPRDICARLNTMLLETQRPYKDTDQESLIIVPCGRITTIRHLLSADTKEEREEWSAYFNKTLTLLRAWGPPQ